MDSTFSRLSHSAIKVATVGEILVEIVAKSQGDGFSDRQDFIGPFASGAPAIFIAQIARLGINSTIYGSVGNDDFGRVNIDRLAREGVDVGNINIDDQLPTGIAFVRYLADGNRKFLFTMKGSAAEKINLSRVDEITADLTHLHVMGSGLGAKPVADFVLQLIPKLKARGGTVSFDPNIRPELISTSRDFKERVRFVLDNCDIFLPSEGELAVFSDASDDEVAIGELLQNGVPEIVLKKGAAGAVYFSKDQRISCPSYSVIETDPTGAGDCFGATFVASRLIGKSPKDSLRYAVASGAYNVTCFGPMEGVANYSTLDRFIEGGKKTNDD